MKMDETLERVQAGPKEVLDVLAVLEQASLTAAAAANEAAKSYYADSEEKAQRLKDRVAALTARRDACQGEIDGLRRQLVTATVAGSTGEVTRITGRVEALEAEHQRLSGEVDILTAAHVPGDAELYASVIEKNTRFLQVHEHYKAAKRRVHTFAGEMQKRYESLEQETKSYYANVGRTIYGGGTGPDLAALDEHYHADVNTRMRAKHAAETAARETMEAGRPRNLMTDPQRVVMG